MLTGISVASYTRLEQGREHHPSERVLNSLARVLDLDPDGTARLRALARPLQRPRPAPAGRASPDLCRLMESWAFTPALLCDRLMNVLATNSLAVALLDELERTDNLFRLTFLDPAAREFFLDWDQIARCAVVLLRTIAAADPGCPRLTDMVHELYSDSHEFRALWARRDTGHTVYPRGRLHHREVGDVTLVSHLFSVDRVPGQQLLVFQAEPDSPSEHALALLGSLTATTA
jgi:transcriptional regulator with XRE-family HTH domain